MLTEDAVAGWSFGISFLVLIITNLISLIGYGLKRKTLHRSFRSVARCNTIFWVVAVMAL